MTTRTLGPQARGSIGPQDAGRAREVARALAEPASPFFVPVADTIPSRCIDGRSPAAGYGGARACAAGATLSLWVARLLAADAPTAEPAQDLEALAISLGSGGLPVGGHGDTHAHAPATGCGATDRLGAILGFLADSDAPAGLAAEFTDVAASPEVARRAGALAARLPSPDRLARGVRGRGDWPLLAGDHGEVALVVNTRPGTTLDRDLLGEASDGAQAFCVDAWSFDRAAREVADRAEDTDPEAVRAAMALYNVATAFVLGAPGLPVVVR